MATRALQQVVTYLAWDTSANAYKTGDSANHSTSWVKDGTRSATSNSAAEVDSTNCPGLYKVTITATETDCIEGVLCGKSSTANIVLIPTMVAFDYLNTSAPATAGIPDVNAKNINNVAATSVTTINANLGTTQPVNYTGTGASALVKGDVVDWKGSAAPAMTGDAYALIGTAGVGLTNLGDTRIAHLDADVSTRATPAQILTTALTESYAADGAAPTVSQALFQIQQFLHDFGISGTTLTVKKLDGSTTAMTFTLDDASSPTSITRAS